MAGSGRVIGGEVLGDAGGWVEGVSVCAEACSIGMLTRTAATPMRRSCLRLGIS
jgi:hypothetical protein